METRRPSNPKEQLAALLSDLDNLTDPEAHPEIFRTYVWDRLFELQEFSSRIDLPTFSVLEAVIRIKEDIANNPDMYQDKAKFAKRLEEIETENKRNFRSE